MDDSYVDPFQTDEYLDLDRDDTDDDGDPIDDDGDYPGAWCPKCGGSGQYWDGPERCPYCFGEGYVWW